jgi:hypothetical protein
MANELLQKIKGIFNENKKNVKFYALMFLVVTLLYFALFSGSGKCIKKVTFPKNPVTAVWKSKY